MRPARSLDALGSLPRRLEQRAQRFRLGWLQQTVVATRVARAILDAEVSRERDDPRSVAGDTPDPRRCSEAIQGAREEEIEDDRIGALGPGYLDGPCAVGRLDDLHAPHLEQGTERRAQLGVVVDDEYSPGRVRARVRHNGV